MTAIALATATRPGDHHDEDPPLDPRFRDAEFGGGTWEEFQAARRRYLRAVSCADRNADPDEPPSRQ
jgi:hypothetical protein